MTTFSSAETGMETVAMEGAELAVEAVAML
jgi:hypothetical protein